MFPLYTNLQIIHILKINEKMLSTGHYKFQSICVRKSFLHKSYSNKTILNTMCHKSKVPNLADPSFTKTKRATHQE